MMLKFWRLFLIIMIPAIIISFFGEHVGGYAVIAALLLVTGVESYLYTTKKSKHTGREKL